MFSYTSNFFTSSNNLFKLFFLFLFLFLLGRSLNIIINSITKTIKGSDNIKLFYADIKIFYPIMGLLLLGNVLFILNFFIPLKQETVFLVVLFLLSFNFKERIEFINFHENIYYLSSFVYLLILFVSVTDISFHYDAGYYHLNNQAWLRESRIIMGFTNIFWPFGISSIYEYISAFFWFDKSFISLHIVNVIFIWSFYTYVFFQVIFKTPLIFSSTFLILFSFLDNFGFNGGRNGFFYVQGIGALDLSVGVLFLIVALNLIMSIKEKKHEKNEIIFLFLFSLFIFQLKVSGAIIIFLLIPYLFYIIKDKFMSLSSLVKINLLPITFFILWVVKTILISGCMIFPVSVSCITNFAWYEDGSTQVFENVTRASSYSYNLGDSFYVWTNNLLSETLRETVLINFFASLLFLYILKKIFFLQKKINSRTKNIKNLFILVSLLFFIFSGPIPRYLIGLLLFIVAVQAINITSFKYEMNVLTRFVSLVFISSVILFSRISSYENIENYLNKTIPLPEIEYVNTDNEWVEPKEGDQCWVNTKCTMEKISTVLDDKSFFTVASKKHIEE